MIYFSTGGYKEGSAYQAALRLRDMGVKHVELSGGKPNVEQISDLCRLQGDLRFIVHNYFPPPQEPFVLNLASLNTEIAERSLQHVRQACDLAQKLKSPYYSLHAGFLLDPPVGELGKKFSNQGIFDRADAKTVFIERMREMSVYAQSRGVRLLLENNVMSHSNWTRFQQNVFLMADAEETLEIMSRLEGSCGLLVDVAHLKVSAQTLGFNAQKCLQDWIPYTEGYHLSDNDGFEDSNQSMADDAWFWPYLKRGLDYYTLEVYDYSESAVSRQMQMTQAHLGEKNI